MYDDLEKLADLKNKGIITEEEFNLKKSQILNQDNNKQSIVIKNELPQNPAFRPKNVENALKLLYISLGIGLLSSIIRAFSADPKIPAPPEFILFFAICILGIIWLFIYKIGKGSNGARITYLVFFILGILFIPVYLKNLETDSTGTLFFVVQTILQIVALIFLFQKPSSDWFREIKRRKI
jgi:hypothetical protein